MPFRFLCVPILVVICTACQAIPEAHPAAEEEEPAFVPIFATEPRASETEEDTLPTAVAERLGAVERPPRSKRWDAIPLQELAEARREESVCERLARRTAEFALRQPDDVRAFLALLQEEVVAGTDDPFELERGLREGRWNQDYFYAGHGGFRAEFDDAERYPRRGNHQPGHFVSVLSIAARFGEAPALIAIGRAGDYDPGEEDDLRLSLEAIEVGVGLRAGTLSPDGAARRVRGLCR